jgi:Protein kinase domain
MTTIFHSFRNFNSGEGREMPKIDEIPKKKPNSLRNAFSRSLDSLSRSFKMPTLRRSKSSDKTSSELSDEEEGDKQHKHAKNNLKTSSSKRELGGGGFQGGPKLFEMLKPKWIRPADPVVRNPVKKVGRDISHPKDNVYQEDISHIEPSSSPKVLGKAALPSTHPKQKAPEFLLCRKNISLLAQEKPQMPVKDSAKTLNSASSLKDVDSTTFLKVDEIPEPPSTATLDMHPESPETRQKALASLINGTTKLSPHFTTRYVLGEMLGDGAFGFVFTAKRITDSVQVAVKFIIRAKITKSNWVDHGLGKVPCEIDTLQKLHHPNVIKYIEHIIEDEYVLLITELFGTSWDVSNLDLDPTIYPGLKFRFHKNFEEKDKCIIKSRTSCDLFECIDARKS